MKKIFFTIWICFCAFLQYSFAQGPIVKADVDKTSILIGEQIRYTIITSFPTKDFKTHGIFLPDSIPHFDVIERGKIDSSTNENNTVIKQSFIITSFDSGKWATPRIKINFVNQKNNNAADFYADTIPINVGYAPADSTNQLRDIKPIIEVKVNNYFWFYVGAGVLLFLILTYFLWHYIKNKKKKSVFKDTNKVSAFDEAMQSLEKLKALNLQNPVEIKQYHFGLSEIFKQYISRSQNNNYRNKTTSDILIQLNDNNLEKDFLSKTATALRLSDAVKFAKFLPAPTDSENALNHIKETITYLNTNKQVNPLTSKQINK